MLVVDAQVHIWEAGQPAPNHRQQPFPVEALLQEMQIAQVDRAILVPPLWDPHLNEYSIQAAARHPDRFAVMGIVDLYRPMDPATFRGWLEQHKFLGIRVSFNSPNLRAVLTSGQADWLWQAASAVGAHVMLLAPQLCALMGMIARQNPGLKLIVDHMAIPRGAKAPGAFAHWPELKALARYPNVAVKMGGVPNYAANDVYPYRSLFGYLKEVIDAFGPNRCFWGSDFSRLHGSYAECVSMFRDELNWLTQDERAAIMGKGLCQWLGWPI